MAEEEELFKIDIDGVESDSESNDKRPQYVVDHFLVEDEGLIEDDDVKPQSNNSECCWNCSKPGHSIRECKLPINRANINKNRKAFSKNHNASKRYHDNKFAKFRPGRLSSELRRALGLRRGEVPEFVYKMRILGYPPGWLAESKISNSGIKMYNDRGKRMPEVGEEEGEIRGKMMKYDVEKIIEIPGFNVPLRSDSVDECRKLGYPRMKSEHQIENFIKHLEEQSEKFGEMDSTDDDSVDMELSEMIPVKIIEEYGPINRPVKYRKVDELGTEETSNLSDRNSKSSLSTAATVEEGEIPDDSLDVRKLNDDTSNSAKDDNNDTLISASNLDREEKNASNLPLEESSSQSNENPSSSNLKQSQPLDIAQNSTNDSSQASSSYGSVTSSTYGTPNLKSHSPFSKLPSFEHFSKNISDVIDFENLPDSVGKYGSLCTIISKVRTYMTSKTSSKSKSAEN